MSTSDTLSWLWRASHKGRASHVTAPSRVERLSAHGGGRDLRLDFFRGLALLFIFIDHVPDNVLSHFTVHSIAFSNAAEVFIFISGYTAALVYGRVLDQRGFVFATAQIFRRVWQLYVAHVFLFVIFVAEVSYTSMRLHNPIYSGEMRLSEFLQMPHVAIAQALILRFQPAFIDILPLYIALLTFFPIALLGIAWNRMAVLIPSAALYGAVQLTGIEVAGFPEGHNWFFNPLAWQLLFVIGAICGYSAGQGRPVASPRQWLMTIAWSIVLVCAVVSISWQVHSVFPSHGALLINRLWPLAGDKTDLAPLRLVNFLALTIVVVRCIHRDSGLLRLRPSRLCILCGQHSLHIFCLGILLSVMGHFVLSEWHDGLVAQLAVNAVGVALMICMALLLEWYKNAERQPPVSRLPQPVQPTTRKAA